MSIGEMVMKFDEISIINALKNAKLSDEREIYKLLKLYGYKIIASGEVFGSAILSSSNNKIIIKVTSDIASSKYGRWAKKRNNPYVLKVYNIIKIKEFFIIFMENLVKLNNRNMSILEEYQYDFVDMIENPAENKDKIKFIDQVYPKLFSVLRKVYAARGNFSWDLAAENFMQRPDGTIVIVDPWADW